MKFKPMPDQITLQSLYHYDPETGIFTSAVDRGKRWKSGRPCGTPTGNGYIAISVNYVVHQAHRLAWVYMTGQPPTYGVDHINGVRSDNRWSNLRAANQSENSGNKSKHKGKRFAKGVHPYGSNGRFRARIEKDGVKRCLGTYATEGEAKAAYDAAAKVLHGSFFLS